MGDNLLTDKLVCWISEVPRGWSLDKCNEKFENCRKTGKFALPAETTR
jgi:hypothetical protein